MSTPAVAVIGAGIAGLSAAFHLHERGLRPIVFEAAPEAGGVVRSERVDGYLVEHGPNSLQVRSLLLETLIEKLGIEAEVQEADPSAKNRYVVRDGFPQPMPLSPPAFLRTGLFSWKAKLRLLREPFISPAQPEARESVADFVRRRLGAEFLDYAVNPFVAGVYAGDPELLSVRHGFPRLHRLEQEYGSLIRGQIKKARHKPMGGPAAGGRMLSFRDGLQTLPSAIARKLAPNVRFENKVVGLRPSNGGWMVTSRGPDGTSASSFDAVLLTVPLFLLPELELGIKGNLQPLAEVTYAPVCVLALGYPRETVEHPLDGFGMLVPAVEKPFRLLGTLFSSTLFPGRAPEGQVLLTNFIGGMRHPELAARPEDELVSMAREDLGQLLGAEGPPSFHRLIRWPRAIPQYRMDYGAVFEAFHTLEAANPGLHFTGNFRQGISVGDTLEAGADAAERIAASLG